MSFVSEHVKKRTRKNLFFSQINQIIDWATIEKELKKCTNAEKKSGAAKPTKFKAFSGMGVSISEIMGKTRAKTPFIETKTD